MNGSLKNKKKLVITVVLAFTVFVAGSYAWFTSSSSTVISATAGRISINSTVENLLGEPDYYYEPGDSINLMYTIDNVHDGNISGEYKTAFVQVGFSDGTVDIYSDDDGNELANSQTYPIDTEIFEDIICTAKTVIDSETHLISAWYVDRTTGTYYALVDAGAEATAEIGMKFDGSKAGNAYQGARFNFNGNFIAVDVNEDAAYDLFELDWNNLDPIDTDGRIITKTGDSGRNSERDYYMNLLYDAENH